MPLTFKATCTSPFSSQFLQVQDFFYFCVFIRSKLFYANNCDEDQVSAHPSSFIAWPDEEAALFWRHTPLLLSYIPWRLESA